MRIKKLHVCPEIPDNSLLCNDYMTTFKQINIWVWIIDLINNYFYRENTSTAMSSWMSGSHYFLPLNAAFDQLKSSSPEGCVLIIKYQVFDIKHPMFLG